MNSIYPIQKGLQKNLEFKGLQAPYLWYALLGIFFLMILFALLHLCGMNSYGCVLLTLGLGVWWIKTLFAWNAKYGPFGMMKLLAQKRIPKVLKSYGRTHFQLHHP